MTELKSPPPELAARPAAAKDDYGYKALKKSLIEFPLSVSFLFACVYIALIHTILQMKSGTVIWTHCSTSKNRTKHLPLLGALMSVREITGND